jgi:hypothetical protein
MKVSKPQSEAQDNAPLTVEQRAEGERNLVRLLGIAKRQGVEAALEEWDRMMDAKDRTLLAGTPEANDPASSTPAASPNSSDWLRADSGGS